MNKLIKRKSIELYLLSFCLVFLTACSSQDIQEKATEESDHSITIMTTDLNEAGNVNDYIEAAERATGLTINLVACPGNGNGDIRQSRILSLLYAKDPSVDVITVNDEMMSSLLGGSNCLEPLNDVMTDDIVNEFPADYLKSMSIKDGNIYSVPYFTDILCFWVNKKYLSEAGLKSISNKQDFVKFINGHYGNGVYGYGGAWEKTYVYNEIGLFINMFGGDIYNWSNPKTREAVTFMHSLINNGETPLDIMADQYDQMVQKFINGKYGCIFVYSGELTNFVALDIYNDNQITIEPLPDFGQNTTYIACWNYVLNSASQHKEDAKIFLQYAASREGQVNYAKAMKKIPTREDARQEVANDVVGFKDVNDYMSHTRLLARPISSDSLQVIEAEGQLFQKYIFNEYTLDEYCNKMQELVDSKLK